MLSADAARTWQSSSSQGSSRAALTRLTMASTEPHEIWAPKSSSASSVLSRRETRFLTARLATAACRREPKAPGGTSGGSAARLGAALRAAQTVQAMLAHACRDHGQLADLVALRRGCVPVLVLAEGARAG